MRYSEADIQEFINDNDVKFIKFSFCDVFGSQKIISVLPSVLPRAFAQGIAVDASRIEGFYKPGDSELFLFPDTDTISLLPWRPSHGRVARFYCHIKDEAGPGVCPGRPENPAGRGGLRQGAGRKGELWRGKRFLLVPHRRGGGAHGHPL